jgi:hypothetical protein
MVFELSVIVVLILLFVFIVASTTDSSNSSHKHPILDQIRARLSRLDPKYASIPLRIGNSAHTRNKNVIVLCIQDEHGRYYDMDTMMYVTLHEVAHVISKSDGHTEEFKSNFSLLLQKAISLGLLNGTKSAPLTYCGVKNR